ncbi:MAG TPA: hypothetical protein VMM13_00465 [Euzebya sp.]|nr:hypothetical protein [Euzebya sp.]
MTTSPPSDPAHPMPLWSDQGQLLVDLAVADLEAGRDVLPSMVAFRGDQPLFLATLRPFLKGQHQDPIIEVGALAMGLQADRILLSLSGRAWSLADPIVPVLPDGGGDLRQRVIVVHQADASTQDPVASSTIVPVEVVQPDVDDGEVSVRTGPALTAPDGEGWVPQALMVLARADGCQAEEEDLGLQVRRCEHLGHRLAWSPTVIPLIQRVRLLGLPPEVAGEGSPADGRQQATGDPARSDVDHDRVA